MCDLYKISGINKGSTSTRDQLQCRIQALRDEGLHLGLNIDMSVSGIKRGMSELLIDRRLGLRDLFLDSKKLCMLHDLFIYYLVLEFLYVGITYDTRFLHMC